MNAVTEPSTVQPRKLSVLLVTSRGLEPYTSLLANSLARYVEVVVFGDSRNYLAEEIPFIQRASKRKQSPAQTTSFGTHAFGTLLWIVDDLVKYAVDTYYLSAAIRRLNSTYIHLQGHFPFFFSLTLGRPNGKNFFWTIHDVELRASRYGVLDRINIALTRMAVCATIVGLHSKAVIVHGESLKREISKSWWAKGKTYSIPHGNYDTIYNAFITPKPETPIAMFFGKIKPYKGLELFIRGAAILARMIPSARFVIAGAGDLTPYSSLIQEAGPEHFEIYNQFIPDEEIPKLFHKASVIVLPYTRGSQSGVLALAYTLGVPVVASRVGSIPEFIDSGRTGFIFEPGNVAEMSDYIYRLMTNRDLCEQFSKNAREKAIRMLSWDEIAQKTLTLYLNLGVSHGPP